VSRTSSQPWLSAQWHANSGHSERKVDLSFERSSTRCRPWRGFLPRRNSLYAAPGSKLKAASAGNITRDIN
jgi:hypothetical protein